MSHRWGKLFWRRKPHRCRHSPCQSYILLCCIRTCQPQVVQNTVHPMSSPCSRSSQKFCKSSHPTNSTLIPSISGFCALGGIELLHPHRTCWSRLAPQLPSCRCVQSLSTMIRPYNARVRFRLRCAMWRIHIAQKNFTRCRAPHSLWPCRLGEGVLHIGISHSYSPIHICSHSHSFRCSNPIWHRCLRSRIAPCRARRNAFFRAGRRLGAHNLKILLMTTPKAGLRAYAVDAPPMHADGNLTVLCSRQQQCSWALSLLASA